MAFTLDVTSMTEPVVPAGVGDAEWGALDERFRLAHESVAATAATGAYGYRELEGSVPSYAGVIRGRGAGTVRRGSRPRHRRLVAGRHGAADGAVARGVECPQQRAARRQAAAARARQRRSADHRRRAVGGRAAAHALRGDLQVRRHHQTLPVPVVRNAAQAGSAHATCFVTDPEQGAPARHRPPRRHSGVRRAGQRRWAVQRAHAGGHAAGGALRRRRGGALRRGDGGARRHHGRQLETNASECSPPQWRATRTPDRDCT